MGFFNNGIFKNVKELENNSDPVVEENLIPPPNLPKWITVYGYKAVTHDMKSFYGNFQFEANKTYFCDGELSPCQNGFHFCLTLKNTCSLFEPRYGKRYFRVKALVPASYHYNNSEEKWIASPKNCSEINNDTSFSPFPLARFQESIKYIAKEITLLEEVPFEEFKEYVNLPYLTKENYFNITCHANYVSFLWEKWRNYASPIFSDSFVDYIFTEKIISKNSLDKDIDIIMSNNLNKAITIMDALKHEKISQEFRVMMLLKELS